jgi:2-oxoisovalerate dehydrogenase E1 component alpha subunit
MLRPLATALGHLPNSHSPIVSALSFFNSVTPPGEKIPTFRVLDGVGKPIDGAQIPDIDEKYARRLYENMQMLPTLDTVLYNVQRQGKISFHVGSPLAIHLCVP